MPDNSATVAFRLREEGFPGGLRPGVVLSEDADMSKVLSRCIKAAKRAGISPRDIQNFQREATSGNFDRFLEVVGQFFELNFS